MVSIQAIIPFHYPTKANRIARVTGFLKADANDEALPEPALVFLDSNETAKRMQSSAGLPALGDQHFVYAFRTGRKYHDKWPTQWGVRYTAMPQANIFVTFAKTALRIIEPEREDWAADQAIAFEESLSGAPL